MFVFLPPPTTYHSAHHHPGLHHDHDNIINRCDTWFLQEYNLCRKPERVLNKCMFEKLVCLLRVA